MRRVLQLFALSGLLATGVLSGSALAQEPASEDAAPPAGETSGDSGSPAAPAPVEVPPPAEEAKPVAETAAPATAPKPKIGDTTTSGYFRGGFGAGFGGAFDAKVGRMTCFALPNPQGLKSKYRLGNECEVWAESHFTTVVYASDDGAVAHLHFMPTVFIPTTALGYSPNGAAGSPAEYTTSTGAVVYFPNLYVDVQDVPGLAGGTAWAGTRYYKRESIYISDFFYWNPSGVGAGIEDIHLGQDPRLSVAVFAVDGDVAPASDGTTPPLRLTSEFGVRLDVQLRGIRPWEGGELQFGVQAIGDLSNHVDATTGNSLTHGGWGITAQFVQKLLGGDNRLALQYGRGGGTGFGTLGRFYYPDFSLTHDPKESRIRVVDVFTIQPTPWFGSQVGLVYQYDDLGTMGAQTTWYSGGARVSVAPFEHFKVLGEAGVDYVTKTNGADPQMLIKATIAPTLTSGRALMNRPELRAFLTFAQWNEAARGVGVDPGNVYRSTDYLNGVNVGLQAETWW